MMDKVHHNVYIEGLNSMTTAQQWPLKHGKTNPM